MSKRVQKKNQKKIQKKILTKMQKWSRHWISTWSTQIILDTKRRPKTGEKIIDEKATDLLNQTLRDLN